MWAGCDRCSEAIDGNKRHANECIPYPQMLFYHIEVNIRAFQCSPKAGLQRAASPLPEREVSSLLTCFSAAVGGNKENWKALIVRSVGMDYKFFRSFGNVIRSFLYLIRKIGIFRRIIITSSYI